MAVDQKTIPPDSFGEILRLEALKKAGKIKSDERIRLSELYFMTSRCSEIKDTFYSSDLSCACGGQCSSSSEITDLMKFRKLVDTNEPWESKKFQALWRKLRNNPVAKYLALKTLRSKKDKITPKIRALQQELERNLDSIEVRAR